MYDEKMTNNDKLKVIKLWTLGFEITEKGSRASTNNNKYLGILQVYAGKYNHTTTRFNTRGEVIDYSYIWLRALVINIINRIESGNFTR